MTHIVISPRADLPLVSGDAVVASEAGFSVALLVVPGGRGFVPLAEFDAPTGVIGRRLLTDVLGEEGTGRAGACHCS